MRPTLSRTSPGGEDGVQIRDVTGQVTRVDRVVIATHADQALGLLTDPSDAETITLKQFGYSRNLTVLHTDSSVPPDATRARACWNYRMTSCGRPGQPAVVTYWMNRLQGHRAARSSWSRSTTANASTWSPSWRRSRRAPGLHPRRVRAQSRLSSLATGRTVYAGEDHGWGIHEDGCRSGVEAARHFGVTW